MSSPTSTTSPGFRHEALLYAGADDFVRQTLLFIEDGLNQAEPILVAVEADKIDRLRRALNGSADLVVFADMGQVGANPARIIPVWSDFVFEHAGEGTSVRGIGEPIWADRGPAELVECQLHESLLNLAFADSAGFTLLCPYDTASLGAEVIEEALHSHPRAQIDGESLQSAQYDPTHWLQTALDKPLPEPETSTRLTFEGIDDLAHVRALVSDAAVQSGFTPDRRSALVLAVHEAATNSLIHGGGSGSLRVWADTQTLICEVRDQGQITDPLVGRVRPARSPMHGRGVWLIQQLADLAQVRSGANGTTVRIHFASG